MAQIRLSQFAILLTGILMASVGYLGYQGALTLRAPVVGTSLVLVALVSFRLGQRVNHPR